MSDPKQPQIRIRTTASSWQCDACPPDRVCAWACVQGFSPEDVIIGASLALDGVPYASPPLDDDSAHALWSSFNA